MGFFSGALDWFVGISVGFLTFVGVPVAVGPTCTMDLSATQLVWSAEESSDVTIVALTNSPKVAGASQTLQDPKPFSGDLNQLFAQNPQPILKELRAHGIPNATFNPGCGEWPCNAGFIDGFNQTKTVANRICEVYFPGSYNSGYGTKKYKSPKNNSILDYNGVLWTQGRASSYPDKGRHIARGPGFSCSRDVTIPTLSGTHTFSPALGVGTHTYRLTAKGPKGTKTCEASITITADDTPDTDPNNDTTPDGDGGEQANDTPPTAQCSDLVDNYNDGDTDYPADLGCTSADDTTEAPNPQCADGIDNNGDGLIDYPNDPACSSDRDQIEEPLPEAALSLVAESNLVQQGTVARLTWSAENVVAGSCRVSGSDGTSIGVSGSSGNVTTLALTNETNFALRCTDLRDKEVSVSITVRIVPSFQEI